MNFLITPRTFINWKFCIKYNVYFILFNSYGTILGYCTYIQLTLHVLRPDYMLFEKYLPFFWIFCHGHWRETRRRPLEFETEPEHSNVGSSPGSWQSKVRQSINGTTSLTSKERNNTRINSNQGFICMYYKEEL